MLVPSSRSPGGLCGCLGRLGRDQTRVGHWKVPISWMPPISCPQAGGCASGCILVLETLQCGVSFPPLAQPAKFGVVFEAQIPIWFCLQGRSEGHRRAGCCPCVLYRAWGFFGVVPILCLAFQPGLQAGKKGDILGFFKCSQECALALKLLGSDGVVYIVNTVISRL